MFKVLSIQADGRARGSNEMVIIYSQKSKNEQNQIIRSKVISRNPVTNLKMQMKDFLLERIRSLLFLC